MELKVLTMTTVYPSALEPTLGVFVRTRVQHMAAHIALKVVTPVALFNYGQHRIIRRSSAPKRYWDGPVEVICTRWLYPPSMGALNGLFLFLQVLIPVLRVRREFHFDVIDAHFAQPEGVAAALLALFLRCPFTVTLRGSEQMHIQHRLRRLVMAWALRRADRVVSVSERLRGLAISLGVRPSRAITIPNGIDADVFYQRDRQQSRAEYEVPQAASLIVSAGHLIELKGHHHIIRAVRALVDQGIDAQLLIAGGRGRAEDYEPQLRSEITTLGLQHHVRLLGHLERDALARLVSAADVFCLASAREGWPNVLHEALACGTPVVAANVGAVPEMIPSEDYGIIVPPGDVAALETGLKRGLLQLWDREAIAAWGQTRSWQQVASDVLSEFEQVVKGPKRNTENGIIS